MKKYAIPTYPIPSYISIKSADIGQDIPQYATYNITVGSTSGGTSTVPPESPNSAINYWVQWNALKYPEEKQTVIDAFLVLGNRNSDKLKEVTEV